MDGDTENVIDGRYFKNIMLRADGDTEKYVIDSRHLKLAVSRFRVPIYQTNNQSVFSSTSYCFLQGRKPKQFMTSILQ